MEKEPVKLRLSTVILMIVIILLSVVVAYFINENSELKKKDEQVGKEVQSIQNRVETVENATNQESNVLNDNNSDYGETNNKTTSSNSSTSSSSNQVKEEKNAKTNKNNEITSQLAKGEVFRIEKVEKVDGKYVLKGTICKTPYTITANEYKDIIKKGKITLDTASDTEEYLVKNSEIFQNEYAIYSNEHPNVEMYRIKKNNSASYIIESETEFTDVYKIKEKNKTITLDGNTKCVYSIDSYNEKTSTVENVFSKNLSFGKCFNFTFKNGKCVQVDEVVIGH